MNIRMKKLDDGILKAEMLEYFHNHECEKTSAGRLRRELCHATYDIRRIANMLYREDKIDRRIDRKYIEYAYPKGFLRPMTDAAKG